MIQFQKARSTSKLEIRLASTPLRTLLSAEAGMSTFTAAFDVVAKGNGRVQHVVVYDGFEHYCMI